MAEDEKQYKITKADGVSSKSSRDYTGRGYAEYANGDIYDGQFVEGIRQGSGKYTYVNLDKYEGQFQANKKHGIGKITYAIKEDADTGKKKGGGSYYGHFENGKKHGEGTFTYVNGDVYSGWWKYGKKSGHGSYIYNDSGMRLIGQWEEGTMLSGKWIYPNGSVYEGEFRYNKPIGEGKWLFKNMNTLDGTYEQTVIPNEDEEDKTVKLKMDWVSNANLFQSANLINCLEDV